MHLAGMQLEGIDCIYSSQIDILIVVNRYRNGGFSKMRKSKTVFVIKQRTKSNIAKRIPQLDSASNRGPETHEVEILPLFLSGICVNF